MTANPNLKKDPIRFRMLTNESQLRRAQSDGESALKKDAVHIPIITNESQVRRAQSDGESKFKKRPDSFPNANK